MTRLKLFKDNSLKQNPVLYRKVIRINRYREMFGKEGIKSAGMGPEISKGE